LLVGYSTIDISLGVVNSIIDKKPDITIKKISELVSEKKRKIGAGFLTDQNVLFLVASDLGITI